VFATLLHLRDRFGLVPDAWEVILEPEHNRHWIGEAIGRAVVATAARLRAAGLTPPEFIAPSTTSMANAPGYFDHLATVPGAAELVRELSYHRYRGVSRANLEAIAERARRYGVRTAMLEHIRADYHELHDDLEIGLASGWQQFVLAYPADDNGAQYFVVDRRLGTVRDAERTQFLRQYFRWVRLGAQRIGASSPVPGVRPLAFVNPDGRAVVVVNAAREVDVAIHGLPEGRYGAEYTTSRERAVGLPDRDLPAGGTLTARLPAAGVLTVFGR
jgi:hypothetical protein